MHPIRFEHDRSDVKPPYDEVVAKIAAILTDLRCIREQAEITGYTDDKGPRLYNQALSERRAQKVANALAKDGVDPNRLTIIGLDGLAPLDPRKNEDARARNRRVTVTIRKQD